MSVRGKRAVLAALLVIAASGAFASSPEMKAVVREMQQAEQRIAVANQAADVAVLRQQSLTLTRLYARIPAGETDAAKTFCTSAIQNLANMSRDLSDRADMAKALSALRARDAYRTYAKRCEDSTGVSAPPSPDLRAR